jgi:rod shape-determining protein MreD
MLFAASYDSQPLGTRTVMPFLRNMVPLASVAVLTLAAALPIGWPTEIHSYMPLLPYTAIHFWAVRRPAQMPEWGVFLAGLTTDVLAHGSHGPLGFWALMFLIGVVAVDATRDMPDWGALGRWGQFCGTLLVLGVSQWLVASIYEVKLQDWRPLLLAITIAALSYPVIGFALRPLHRLWGRAETGGLSRSGARGDNPTMSRGQSLLAKPPASRGA